MSDSSYQDVFGLGSKILCLEEANKAECRSAPNADGAAGNQRKGKRRTKKSGDALLADDDESDAIPAAEADDF